MDNTYNVLLVEVTNEFIAGVDFDNPPTVDELEIGLVHFTNDAIAKYNVDPNDPSKQRTADERFRKLLTLAPVQVAMLIVARCHACKILMMENSDEENYIIGLYADEGPEMGTYRTGETYLNSVIRRFNMTITPKDMGSVRQVLMDIAPVKTLCRDKDLIAVNNGIFDYRNKILMDFDPELVFISKCHVNYIPDAVNPVITMPDGVNWDVESWMGTLSDNPKIVDLLWQVCGAIIRPNVPWNKSAWLYSEQGNNGKGTLCTLMRNLCGNGAYAAIKLKQFSEDFMLEQLPRVSAIITDENDVGTYIDKGAELKAVITNDALQINRKFKKAVTIRFRGFMVQCVNEMPRVRDKTNSMYRRLLIIPMMKSFKGTERKYIKNDYLGRDDVLEYVLFKVLHEMNYYELDEPTECKVLLSEYQEFNDPVRAFLADLLEQATWSLLPWSFVYDAYVAWNKRYNVSGKMEGFRAFTKDVRLLIEEFPDWKVTDKCRSANRMSEPELLIEEWDIVTWMSKTYKGNDINKICSPDLKVMYKGLVRIETSDDGREEEE